MEPANDGPIALLLPSLAGGGAQRVFIDVAKALVEAGEAVDMVLGQIGGRFAEQLDPRVRLVELGARRSLASIMPLRRYLKERRPRVLHPALQHSNVIAAAACWGLRPRPRLIAGVHNTMSVKLGKGASLGDRVTGFLLPWALRQADDVLACSKGSLDDIIAHFGAAPEKSTMIYNPVRLDEIAELAKEPTGIDWIDARSREDEPKMLTAVGRFNPQKNFPLLLDAFAAVSRRWNARLVLIGEGALEDALRAHAAGLGVADKVDFVGFRTNPYAFLGRSDLFVLSSNFEGFGVVLVEAMALGCKVVSTNCPSGPDEILEGGVHGRLTPVGDAPAFAAAIEAALAEPGGREPSPKVREFDAPKCCAQYVAYLTGRDQRPGDKV